MENFKIIITGDILELLAWAKQIEIGAFGSLASIVIEKVALFLFEFTSGHIKFSPITLLDRTCKDNNKQIHQELNANQIA